MKKLFFVAFIFFALCQTAFTQSVNAPLNEDYYHLLDRYEIKSGKFSESFFTSMKPYKRSAIAAFADSIHNESTALTERDQFNLTYLANDNWEWSSTDQNSSKKPFLKHFYKAKSDLFHVASKDFDLHLNPVLYLSTGNDTDSDIRPFINTRGVQVRGMIDKKVGFYSFIGENQAIFPFYVRDKIGKENIVPHEGFWKKFKDNGVDFFTARGYISFEATKHINLQFGHDQFSIGNGHRSLILSNYAPAYLFLKVNTQVWKIKYTNLFTQLTADATGSNSGSLAIGEYPSKYMTFHHLGVNIGKNLNVGLFEAVVYRTDSASANGFDPNYLNPIIFYRAIEQQNGSVDNALLGLDFKWNFARRFSLYGQLALDEFLLERLKEGNGWWANKFAIQAGGKYIDAFGIPNLDLQGEMNLARPYIYSHGSDYGSYSHYLQPLAHPLGANFTELIGIARYQPIPKLNITGKFIYSSYGADTTGVNYGGDILKRNTTREQDFGNTIGQGISNTLNYLNLTASFQFRHNLFIDLSQTFRQVESELDIFKQKTSYTALSLRWNISQRYHEF